MKQGKKKEQINETLKEKLHRKILSMWKLSINDLIKCWKGNLEEANCLYQICILSWVADKEKETIENIFMIKNQRI